MAELLQQPKVVPPAITGSVVLLVPQLRITGGQGGIGVSVSVSSGVASGGSAASPQPRVRPAR